MVQNTYNRATTFSKEILVVPDISHASLLREQLPVLDDAHCVTEPGRRGTANCIVAALVHISKSNMDPNEPIAFISADHHVRDASGFAKSFQIAGEISNAVKKIALIGIEPTYPATGFGYIERNGEVEGSRNSYIVKSFKEKPDFETAKSYMQAGNYLWNCGYFVGSLNTFVTEMKKSAPELYANYEALAAVKPGDDKKYSEVYLGFKNDTIDYALIEKTKDLVVVPASFDWMDVGNFKDLHDVVSKDEQGNYFEGDSIHTMDVGSVYIRNEENKPVAVIGLDNVVVVNTPDGILVSRKDLVSRVGEVAKKLQS